MDSVYTAFVSFFPLPSTIFISGQLSSSELYCCLLNSAGLNWLMVRLGSETCTVYSISAQPSLEGIKVTKAKEYLYVRP